MKNLTITDSADLHLGVYIKWFDLNIERRNREAPSPSFLQEKIKTLEITGRVRS